MDEFLIPYAKLITDGRLVTIDEVESGLACNCICDGCGSPMVARKGQEKAHHFGHAPKSTNEDKPCTFNFKRGCFWLIRQILEESVGSEIELPDYVLLLRNNLARHQKSYQVTHESKPLYEKVLSFELSQNNETAIAVLAIGKHRLHLTFGFPSAFKRPNKACDGCAEIFVSLANVYDAYTKEKKPFIQVIKAHIFSSHFKEWMFHPRQTKLELQFKAVCDDIISEMKQQAPLQFKPTETKPVSQQVKPEQHYAVRPRAESISAEARDVIKFNKRLDEMVNSADALYTILKQSQAKHCDKCQFLYMVTNTKCPTCGDYTSATIQLDAHYMHNLAQKYQKVGYVDLSLKNFPKTS